MDHDTLDRMRQSHPAWRVLVADNAPLILGFFIISFIRPNRRAISAPEITAQLSSYLDHLREVYPERYPRSAREYLEEWAAPNRAYVRKYYPKSGAEAEFDLTPATERAIEWLQTLSPQPFIGTESRLLTLFQLLRELAVGAEPDPAARVRDLEKRRDEIEQEIEHVRQGRTGPLDPTQIKERHAQLAETARRLLADFRQIEENFRVLDAQMRERIAVSTQPKGALLDDIFGEADHIQRSDQGKSFTAFWEFLMSPVRQDELRQWLRAVQGLSTLQKEAREDDFVHNIPSLLLDAGEKVHGTVAQLVDQLRRFVDDQVHLENRRILDLIHEIETHAIALKAAPPLAPDVAHMEGFAPEWNLSLCRSLFRPPRNPVLDLEAIETGVAELDFGALFRQTTVDEGVLRSQIATLLESRSQVTLAEVARAYPPQQGIAEIVTYLRIAAQEGAAVDETVEDTLIVSSGASRGGGDERRELKQVSLRRVIFIRERHG
ncbi:DUF3375 domain-containing protein [Steroidobacter flavus]|uniref:DUF3375 domain-containing protein n=1 Tax=Steroidobacter flavus TaxID=1842136 RepID=A0ABV8SZE5_9GAMM